MDRILKIVYDNWILADNENHALPNGIHSIVFQKIKNKIDNNRKFHQAMDEVRKEISGDVIPFDHSNFYGYTIKKLNHIDINNIDIRSNDIYLYPIEIKGDLLSVINKKKLLYENNVIIYNLEDTINSNILNLIQNGRVKILIHAAQDPYYHHNMNNLESYFKNLGIDTKNLIFVPGNNNREEYLDHNPTGRIKISSVPLMITRNVAKMLAEYPIVTRLGYVSDLVREIDLDSNILRPYKFICLNRTMRPHRYAMAYFAVKNNLLKNNIFTFLNYFNSNEIDIENQLSNFDIPIIERKEYSKLILKILPYELDTHGLNEKARGEISIDNTKKEWYLKTYINIVTETSFINGRHPFISEKLWRPVTNLQPFILVGNYGTLKYIKKLGFKTFSSFIDESYDSVYDPKKRMNLIFKEIEKLNSLSIKQLHDWYYSITDILLHNLKTLQDLKNIDPYQVLYDDLIETYK
jgi:hypothetical protein